MNKTKKYIIKFTPLDRFFWGGKDTFGVNNENYFVKSRLFPQQTSLLGAIRYMVLIQNNLLKQTPVGLKISDPDEAARYIGSESFRVSKASDNSFGKIKSLSPVFLMKGDQYYFVKPFDQDFNLVFKEGRSLLYSEKPFIAFYENYDAKKKYTPMVSGLNDEYYFYKQTQTKKSSYVFVDKSQVGIKKDYGGASQENSFYKLSALGLNNGFSFAVEAETDTDLQTLRPGFFKIGTKRYEFKTEILEHVELNYEHFFTKKNTTNRTRVVLLSDALVSEDIREYYDFADIKSVPFKNLHTTTKTNNYHAHPGKGSGVSKSNQFNLIEKASVFYVPDDKLSQFESILGQAYLQKIGYNHYIKR